ncbi:hypothetical protein Tco_0556120 [Tanacetum coccineum]
MCNDRCPGSGAAQVIKIDFKIPLVELEEGRQVSGKHQENPGRIGTYLKVAFLRLVSVILRSNMLPTKIRTFLALPFGRSADNGTDGDFSALVHLGAYGRSCRLIRVCVDPDRQAGISRSSHAFLVTREERAGIEMEIQIIQVRDVLPPSSAGSQKTIRVLFVPDEIREDRKNTRVLSATGRKDGERGIDIVISNFSAIKFFEAVVGDELYRQFTTRGFYSQFGGNWIDMSDVTPENFEKIIKLREKNQSNYSIKPRFDTLRLRH